MPRENKAGFGWSIEFAGRATRLNVVVIVLGCLLGGCASLRRSAGVVAEAQDETRTDWQRVVLGLGEDYPEETRSLARAREDLAAARGAGAQALRIAFRWDAMEPERGRYDWSFWDEFVRMAVEEFQLRLIPYACYTPKWAARDQSENFWRSPPRDPEDFARFMTALVTRYQHAIDSWELWNEPDNRAYWLGTPHEFAELVRAGSRAVRAADPRATIVLGGIASETTFLEELFRVERIAPQVDVVNIHSYFETWHPDPIESLPEYVERAATIVREHGENEPLWMAETGYSSVGGRAVVSEVYRARYRGEHTERAQAAALARTAVLSIATGRLPLFAWYRINDLPTAEEVIGDDNNRHLGVRAVDRRAKPALAAFTQLTRLFAQPYRIIRPEMRITGHIGPPVEVHAFELEDGRHVVVAWLGMAPSEKNPASSVHPMVEDQRRANVRVRLPIRHASVKATDATGRLLERGVVSFETTPRRTDLRLQLSGGEVLLCVLEPARPAGPAAPEGKPVRNCTSAAECSRPFVLGAARRAPAMANDPRSSR